MSNTPTPTSTPTPAPWCEHAGQGAFDIAPQLPAGMVAGGTYTITLHRSHACQGMPVSFAPHRTAHHQYNPAEVQPLYEDGAVTTTGDTITFTVPLRTGDLCATDVHVQGDLVNGAPLDQVNPQRYNQPDANAWRLLDAQYIDGADSTACTPPAPPTTDTTVDTPTTSSSVPEVVAAPPTDTPSTTTSAPTATVVVTGVPTPIPTLPHTGADPMPLLVAGAVLVLGGAAVWRKARQLARRAA